MADDKTHEELRAIREEAERRAKDKKHEADRKANYYAARDRGGDGTKASERAHDATKDFL